MKKIIISASTFLLPLVAFAQVTAPPPGVRNINGVINIFNVAINWLFTILLIFAVLVIILAAFQYLTAGGDEEAVKKANKKILMAVVAIAVAFLARGVVYVVAQLLDSGGAGATGVL